MKRPDHPYFTDVLKIAAPKPKADQKPPDARRPQANK
jgi:hypothetical protein